MLTGLQIYSRGRCAFVAIAPHPRITRDKRKIARLAIFPNFLRYAPKTSFIPDVEQNVARSASLGILLNACACQHCRTKRCLRCRFATLRPTAAYAKCPSENSASLEFSSGHFASSARIRRNNFVPFNILNNLL